MVNMFLENELSTIFGRALGTFIYKILYHSVESFVTSVFLNLFLTLFYGSDKAHERSVSTFGLVCTYNVNRW